jgi:hypothetical protein
MEKADFKYLAKTYLRLKIEHEDGRIKVCLMFEDNVIDYDYIDYSEVVRVVDRLNAGDYQ